MALDSSARNLGTPKTLDEAIAQAICIGPAGETPERLYLSIKDFLSQKFGVAFLQAATSKERARVQDLWNRVVQR